MKNLNHKRPKNARTKLIYYLVDRANTIKQAAANKSWLVKCSPHAVRFNRSNQQSFCSHGTSLAVMSLHPPPPLIKTRNLPSPLLDSHLTTRPPFQSYYLTILPSFPPCHLTILPSCYLTTLQPFPTPTLRHSHRQIKHSKVTTLALLSLPTLLLA